MIRDTVSLIWLQNETTCVSGESMIKQLQYGQNFFQQAFGKVSDELYNIDFFSLNPTYPQIAAKAGLTMGSGNMPILMES